MNARKRLHQQPLGEEFDLFVQQSSLFEHGHFEEVESLLDDLGIQPTSETAYLVTFSYTAGGWTQAVPRHLLEDHGIESLTDAVQAANAGELQDLSEHATGHSHRHHVQATKISQTLGDLDRLGAPSFVAWLQDLRDKGEDRIARFCTALESIQRVDTIGPVTAFDWLELVVRVQGDTWLGPDRFHADFFQGGHPGDGFERVFGHGVEHPDADEAFRVLERYGESLGLSPVETIFDLESCLCVFADQSKEDLEALRETESEGLESGHTC